MNTHTHTHAYTRNRTFNTHGCIHLLCLALVFAATVAATAASCCKLFLLATERYKQVKCKLSSDHNMLCQANYEHLLIVQQAKESRKVRAERVHTVQIPCKGEKGKLLSKSHMCNSERVSTSRASAFDYANLNKFCR